MANGLRVLMTVAGAASLAWAGALAQTPDPAACGAKAALHTTTSDKDGAYQACLDGREYVPGQARRDADQASAHKALTALCETRAKVAFASGDKRSEVFADCMAGAPYSPPARPPLPQVHHYIDSFGIVEVNTAGGVEPYVIFVNPNAKSAIKYVHLQMRLYNAVGDPIRSRIGGHNVASLSYTGPLEAGRDPEKADWEPLWYNHSGHCVTITSVSVEFMNGRKESFSGKGVLKALAPGLSNDCRIR